MYSEEINEIGPAKKPLNLESLPKDMYFLKIQNGNESTVKKLLIRKTTMFSLKI